MVTNSPHLMFPKWCSVTVPKVLCSYYYYLCLQGGGYEDEKVEERRMKKYVQMDDPHCKHLGDAEVDEILVSFCMQEDLSRSVS
jgi:hypothetical protein